MRTRRFLSPLLSSFEGGRQCSFRQPSSVSVPRRCIQVRPLSVNQHSASCPALSTDQNKTPKSPFTDQSKTPNTLSRPPRARHSDLERIDTDRRENASVAASRRPQWIRWRGRHRPSVWLRQLGERAMQGQVDEVRAMMEQGGRSRCLKAQLQLVVAHTRKNGLPGFKLGLDEARALGMESVFPAFNQVLSMCSRSGELNLAVKVLRLMKSMRVAPDRVTYDTMIRMFADRMKIRRAMELAAEAEAEELLNSRWQIGPLAFVLRRAGRHDQARALHRAFRDGLDSQELARLLDQGGRQPASRKQGHDPSPLASPGDVAILQATYDTLSKGAKGFAEALPKLRDHGEELAILCYVEIISLFRHPQDAKACLQMLSELERKVGRLPPVAAEECLDRLCDWRKAREALNLLQQIENANIRMRSETYARLIFACCKAEDLASAQKIFEERVSLASEEEQQSAALVSAGMSLFIQLDDLEKARQLREHASSLGLKASREVSIMSLWLACKMKQVWEALALLKQLRESSTHPGFFAYTKLLETLREERMMEEAHQVYSMMKEDDVDPPASLLSLLIEMFCENEGGMSHAQDVFDHLLDKHKGVSPEVCLAMYSGYQSAGQVGECTAFKNRFQELCEQEKT